MTIEKPKSRKIIYQDNVKSVFVDFISIAKRPDGMMLLSGAQMRPDNKLIEDVRLMITKDHAIRFAKAFASALEIDESEGADEETD